MPVSTAKKLQALREEYQKSPSREAHLKVKAAAKELSDKITEGAKPCPTCGGAPHGIAQPRGDGTEYEVGCTSCGWFIHTDGTIRDHGARGGILPKHTVEAWNSGPDFWKTKARERFSEDELAKLEAKKK